MRPKPIVEDSDAPSPKPLLHPLAWDLPTAMISINEGLFRTHQNESLEQNLGRNSFLQAT